MENVLDPHGAQLLEQYHQRLPQLKLLEQQVVQLLTQALSRQDISLSSLEHRIKTEPSLIGKLERKGQKYQDINQITDLLGIRIVTFFTDDVDRVAAFVKEIFEVDWKESVDKRKSHELTSFGYNSLHYICHLRKDATTTDGLSDIPFEIQMRTMLQHAWSAMEHDIGYKGFVRLPGEYLRQFSRLAGMLELADDEFSRLRTTMNKYRRDVQRLVTSGHLDEVPLNNDTFRDYLQTHPFNRLNERIAAVNQAEIISASLLPFCPVLESFGLETLGNVAAFIQDNLEDAYQLALAQLATTDIDIISEYVGVQNLCFVHVLKNGGGRAGIKRVYDIIFGEQDKNAFAADRIMKQAMSLPFMT